MSVHDSRTARAAAGGEDHGESVDETSTVFEWPTRQQAAKNHGENNKTSTIFEWPTRQQAAKNHGEKRNRTSTIFERPPRQQAAENQDEPVKPPHTPPTVDDKTKHPDLFEAGANLSRERRLNDNHGGFALLPQRPAGSQLEPDRDSLHVSSKPEA